MTITKTPKRCVLDDDFVQFTENEHLINVVKPFGYNSRYWIVAEDEAGLGEVEEIRTLIDAHHILGVFND